MPKLSDIKIDTTKFKGKGLRPWTDNTGISSLLKNNDQDNDNKALAMREQCVSNNKNIKQEQKHKTKSVSKALAKHEQYVSNTLAENIELTTGKERDFLVIINAECIQNNSLETRKINTDELKEKLKVSPERLRNLIFRLSQKKLINTKTVKNGRGGWRIFSIPEKT